VNFLCDTKVDAEEVRQELEAYRPAGVIFKVRQFEPFVNDLEERLEASSRYNELAGRRVERLEVSLLKAKFAIAVIVVVTMGFEFYRVFL
jgi:cbb3-type cytochrome oxidase cytochrome c subunit